MPPSYDQLHHSLIPTRAPSCAAQRRFASLSWPSTVVPQSALARRGHGVHRTTTTLRHREKVVTSRDIVTHGRPKTPRQETRILQMHVSSVFRCMLQVFYMDVAKVDRDVASVSEVCCKCFRDMWQASIQNVSSVSDVCCKCFI
jgi:hypothetical protein